MSYCCTSDSAAQPSNTSLSASMFSSAKMVKMGKGKSTQDAGWAMFKTMLKYKSREAGVVFVEGKSSINPVF